MPVLLVAQERLLLATIDAVRRGPDQHAFEVAPSALYITGACWLVRKVLGVLLAGAADDAIALTDVLGQRKQTFDTVVRHFVRVHALLSLFKFLVHRARTVSLFWQRHIWKPALLANANLVGHINSRTLAEVLLLKHTAATLVGPEFKREAFIFAVFGRLNLLEW